MREKKTHFIIIRVTTSEKENMVRMAQEAKKRLSTFIRMILKLDK